MSQQPPISDPVIGRTLDGRYLIEATIAAGGMATVYRGTDVRLQRAVAVKIMHSHLAADQQFRDRFLHEALSSARLTHPNIVNVYDQGHESGLWYLVMEYVPSITLRDLMREHGALSPYQALSILSPALAGLGAAHDAGILHRDLKPENILLADDGRIKLADFGLARAVSAHTSPTQNLIGSVAYMSPELLARGNADARSDIYAMGIILYEMLVGSRPFAGTDPVQIALQHANDPVPAPSATNPRVPVEVDELVYWSTAKRPEDRPRDAHILREQTDDVLAALPADSSRPAVKGATLPTLVMASNAAEPTAIMRSAPVAIPSAPTPLQGDVERLQRRNRTSGRRGGLLLIVILLLAALAGGTGWYFASGPGAMTIIPDVTTMSEADATAQLTAAGFTVLTQPQNDLTVPAGTVMGTDPDPRSSAFPGASVTLIVSAGPANATVPAVVGSKLDVATAALQERHLVVAPDPLSEFSSQPQGTVLALAASGASVSEGQTLLQGTTVTFTVSLGAIPTVVGATQSDATSQLQNVGLTATVASTEFSDTVASGVVISQSSAKKTMAKGDTVLLVVSKGQDLVAVPTGVVGTSVSDGVKKLQAAGFNVVISNDWLPDAIKTIAKVSRIDPTEGSQVKRGSTVTIYWSYTS